RIVSDYNEVVVSASAALIRVIGVFRRQSWPLALASAFLYFCGAAAKEVYAPVILILAAMPEGSPRQRLRFAVPHAVAAVAFIVWRGVVIGWSVAPFGFVVPAEKRPLAIVTIPLRAAREFAGSGTAAGWALLVMVLVCAAVAVVRLRGARLLAAAAIVVAVGPLIPVRGGLD